MKALCGTTNVTRDAVPALIVGAKVKDFDSIAASIDQCPMRGGKDGRAWHLFEEKCRQLIALGVMEDTYLEEVFWWAVWQDQALLALYHVNRDERFTKVNTRDGVRFVENPWWRHLRDAMRELETLTSKLGLSPVDRQRLALQAENRDPADIIFSKMDD